MSNATITVRFARLAALTVLGSALFACSAPPPPERKASTASHLDGTEDTGGSDLNAGGGDTDTSGGDRGAGGDDRAAAGDDRAAAGDDLSNPPEQQASNGSADANDPAAPNYWPTVPAIRVAPDGQDPNGDFTRCGEGSCFSCSGGQCTKFPDPQNRF
jgi:hypothetical protein